MMPWSARIEAIHHHGSWSLRSMCDNTTPVAPEPKSRPDSRTPSEDPKVTARDRAASEPSVGVRSGSTPVGPGDGGKEDATRVAVGEGGAFGAVEAEFGALAVHAPSVIATIDRTIRVPRRARSTSHLYDSPGGPGLRAAFSAGARPGRRA